MRWVAGFWSNLVKISPNLIEISSDLRLRQIQRGWTVVFSKLYVLLLTMCKEILKKKKLHVNSNSVYRLIGWFSEFYVQNLPHICYYTLTEICALRGRTSKAINKRKACVKISLKQASLKLDFNEIHIYFCVVSEVVLLYFTQFHFIFTCSHFTHFKFDCVAVYWNRIQRHQTMGWRPEPKSLSVDTSSKFITVACKWQIINKKTLECKKNM